MPYEWIRSENKWREFEHPVRGQCEFTFDCPSCNRPCCGENWREVYTDFREHIESMRDCKYHCKKLKQTVIPEWLDEIDSKQTQPVLSGEPDETWWIDKTSKRERRKKREERNKKREELLHSPSKNKYAHYTFHDIRDHNSDAYHSDAYLVSFAVDTPDR